MTAPASAETTTMTTAEAAVESLIRHGIDTLYALPGLHNDPLFDALYGARNRLRIIHPRHEQTAAYMALGAAMATGKPQAFAVVPGPGFLNTTAALLTAYGANAPVLGLIGQIPQSQIDRGHGHLHELHDQIGMAGHIAKYTARITAPYEAPLKIRDAMRAMTSGRPRPAVLECAMDVWEQRGAVAFPPDLLAAPDVAPIDVAAVEAAARLLGAAKRPVIVVGGGAIEASAAVIALAEALEAPVISYRKGRGVIPTAHRLAADMPTGHRLWKDADAVLAIGTRLLIQQGWGIDKSLPVVRLDIDPEEHGRAGPPAVALIGDAKPYAEALLKALPAHNPQRPSRAAEMDGLRALLAERLSRLEPQVSYLNVIRAALPDDGIFIEDVTQLGFASRIALPVHLPRTFLSPGYQDNLGWAYGTALGAKAAKPDTPVVCVAGDGGFMYQAAELSTAMQHNIGVVVVVFDNALFGNVRRIQEEKYEGRVLNSDLVNPDFVKLAQAFGMDAYRVETPAALEATLRTAFAKNAPALVHVPCGEMPSPWDMILMPKVRGG